jgi:hypothetical protein
MLMAYCSAAGLDVQWALLHYVAELANLVTALSNCNSNGLSIATEQGIVAPITKGPIPTASEVFALMKATLRVKFSKE